jgi:hypothetical protein
MSKFVEVNTDYIDENGVQHIDGYTSNSDDAEGCVVAYFVNGEAYYTNPDYRYDELIKATVNGLKLEYDKTAQSKYKDVVESIKMLQIHDNAISHAIALYMYLGLAFIDNDSEIGEVIYYGNVFETIRDNDKIPTKFKDGLNDLIELCKDYQYVMVTKT